MPHKVGNKWKWGNVERRDKDDLRKTVYGIWMKNGGKGSFSKFWKTGKINESAGISFEKVERADIPDLLDKIGSYAENTRWDRSKFEKYLDSEKRIDTEGMSMFYGAFADGRCLALSYLNKVPDRCVLIAQVSSVAKGFGKILINNILERAKNVWWAVDPEGGDGLLGYYRDNFGDVAEEIEISRSIWPATRFFVKASGKGYEAIAAKLKQAESGA